jgi:preprotein translocase subunit YajC
MNLKKLCRVVSAVLAVALLCLCMTGCATTGTSEDGSTASSLSMIIMMVVLIAVFYFFLIRPENKKKKQLQQMRDALSVGDSITTIGGIIGKIVSIKDDTITFETGEDRVRIQVAKWAISTTGKNNTEEPK